MRPNQVVFNWMHYEAYQDYASGRRFDFLMPNYCFYSLCYVAKTVFITRASVVINLFNYFLQTYGRFLKCLNYLKLLLDPLDLEFHARVI